MGIGVIAAYLTFVPCAHRLSELLGLHTTGNPATCAAACGAPSIAYGNSAIAAECGMMIIERLQGEDRIARRAARMRNAGLAS